ncbi:lysocardiolipin acyltransferase 1-like [Folsomia candida]|nr:lysocardiolipin acyltransferase 1-like [Folsomia candida]
MGYVKGISFVLLWYIGIIWSVIYVYAPFLILLPFSRKWYRKVTDIILSCWEMYPVSLLQLMMGCRICLSGDEIDPAESAIIIMNHRNRLDWFFLWAALLHGCPAHRCKFVLKSYVRWIPGIGWGLQMAGFLFLHRNWKKDQEFLRRSLNYFKKLDENYLILIFPEGNHLFAATKKKSNAFAKKAGLPGYDYVLHPRTTGFTFLVQQMQKNSRLDAVYDLTIAYPKTLPINELDILSGKIPEEVHFNISRYEGDTLPRDEEGIKTWCEQRWAEKETSLKKFYSEKNPNLRRLSSKVRFARPWNAMFLAIASWTGITVFTTYLTFFTTCGFYYTCFSISGFVLVSYFTYGIQNFELDLFYKYDCLDVSQ